ncbi:MAG: PEP-CTERM sorting domain-containing protein [Chthonomonadales bacterium]|nr:PEP-CTERM sorting domain-containing protein [Chthonomonadales bacterium]
MMNPLSALVGLAALALVAGGAGAQVTVSVPGTSDPWLAGMPAGSTASSGDVAPAQSPVEVLGLTLVGGALLTFDATGSVSNTPSPSGLTPDGGGFVGHSAGDENGIANVVAPNNSLVGVFLDAGQPDLTPAPATLNFIGIGLDFVGLSPLLKQVFFIGDGVTSGSVAQQFTVPAGATRLYLGTMDGYGWYNNSGSFTVRVSGGAATPAVPEPSPLAALACGGLVLGGLALRRSLRA